MKILFVCTGNTCRSPMAEAVARAVFKEKDYEFISAGISAAEGVGASENAVLAAEKLGLDLSGHESRQITREMVEEVDLILTMTNGHKQALSVFAGQVSTPVFTLCEYCGVNEEIPDPFGCSLETYEECIAVLKEYILKVFDVLEG